MSTKTNVNTEPAAADSQPVTPAAAANAAPDPAPEPGTATDSAAAPAARQAAKYRNKLRETEAERDTLARQVEAMRAAEIDRVVVAPFEIAPDPSDNHAIDPATGQPRPVQVSLTHPGDLFTIGSVDRGGLLDQAGQVDPAKVTAALTALHSVRPDLFTRAHGAVPTIGTTPAHAIAPGGSWEGAFVPKRR